MVRTGFTLVAIVVGLGDFWAVAFVVVLICFAGALVRFGAEPVFFGSTIL